MADYLLDANHLSPLATPNHPLRDRIVRQLRLGDNFSIAVPALTEMLYGIQILPRARQNMTEWRKFSEAFNYYDIDRRDAERAAILQVNLRRRG